MNRIINITITVLISSLIVACDSPPASRPQVMQENSDQTNPAVIVAKKENPETPSSISKPMTPIPINSPAL